MSDLDGTPNCCFSHAQAHFSICQVCSNLMHQSFVSPPPPGGDSRGIAGLKCWGLTSDVSRQCRGCAVVITSRQYSGGKSSSSIQFCYICVYQVINSIRLDKGVCRNCNVSKVCPFPLLYATFTDIFGLCQHSLIHFLHFFVSNHTFKHKCLTLTARTI